MSRDDLVRASGDDAVRVSDADRERVAREIREHFAVGRLNDDELNERLDAAYAARTAGELRAARADLPDLPLPPREQRKLLVQRRRDLTRRMIQEAGGGLVPFVVTTVIWAATGAGFFWPIFVLIAVLIPVLSTAWKLYGPAPDIEQVERELNRQRRRSGRRGHRGGKPRRGGGRHTGGPGTPD